MTAALRVPRYTMDHAMPDQIPPKRLAIELPDDERGRSPQEVHRLDVLNRRLSKPIPRGDKKAERAWDAAMAERETLERRPHAAAENRWAKAANEESAELARGRGEAVEDTGGVKRILDRDPLAGLTWLTKEQFDAGQEMREAYLLRADDLGAVEFTGMPGSPHDNDKFVRARLKRAKATNYVARVERRVALDCRHEPVALQMLRVVCERGFTLTSQGRGRAYDRNCKALAMALDVAEAVRKGGG